MKRCVRVTIKKKKKAEREREKTSPSALFGDQQTLHLAFLSIYEKPKHLQHEKGKSGEEKEPSLKKNVVGQPSLQIKKKKACLTSLSFTMIPKIKLVFKKRKGRCVYIYVCEDFLYRRRSTETGVAHLSRVAKRLR